MPGIGEGETVSSCMLTQPRERVMLWPMGVRQVVAIWV